MDELWIQRQIDLRPRPRGFHLVTSEVVEAVPELGRIAVGIATVFIQHTSASLTLNENASPDVRRDFAAWFDRAVPDGAPYFRHTLEGPDDMPAHIKSSLTGAPHIPVTTAGWRSAPGRGSTSASTATAAARGGSCLRRSGSLRRRSRMRPSTAAGSGFAGGRGGRGSVRGASPVTRCVVCRGLDVAGGASRLRGTPRSSLSWRGARRAGAARCVRAG